MTTKTEQCSDAATDRRCAICQQPVQDSPWGCANAERHAFCRVCVEDWKGSFDCPIDGAPVVS